MGNATIASSLHLRRYEVLRSLRYCLQAQTQCHHTTDLLQERCRKRNAFLFFFLVDGVKGGVGVRGGWGGVRGFDTRVKPAKMCEEYMQYIVCLNARVDAVHSTVKCRSICST